MVNETYMAGNRAFFATAALALGLLLAVSGRASAEFFGCDDQHSTRTYTRSYAPPRAYSHTYTSHNYASQHYASHAFSAQRRPAYAYDRNDPFYALRAGFH